MTVFGSKSECFKCGTKQGGSGNSGKVGAASTIVGTASLSKSDRALIRDLMADSAATGSVSASSPTTTTSMGTNHAKNVHKQLRGMGFHEQDLARAIEMCGGLSTIEGSLNWLLLHCPEERVPKDLATTGGDSRSVIQRARKRRNQKKAAPKKKVDVSKMTDMRRCVHNIESLGFDSEDVEFCVKKARKSNWYPEPLKSLFEFCNITWHYRCIVGKDGDITSATIKQAKAREKAALNALYPADTGIFKVLGNRSDAWRLRFRVSDFKVTPGEDISRWSDVAVKNWVRSVTYKECCCLYTAMRGLG